MISNRIKKILGIILQTKESVNVSQISEEIGVSERTIYRELPEVTEILSENNIRLDTVSKKGIITIGSMEDKEKLMYKMDINREVYIVDPEERIDMILFELLFQDDYVKADALAIDNGISTPTVRNDLKKIKKRLEEFNLKLDLKKGDGIYVHGNPVDKNHYACNILMKHVNESDLLKWLNGKEIFQPFLRKMEKLEFQPVFIQCHELLKNIFHKQDDDSIRLNDQEYMQVIFLLGMMILWHQKKDSYIKVFDYKEDKGIEKFTVEIADLLEAKFELELSKLEIEYIEVVLNIVAVYNTTGFYTIRNQQLDKKFGQFISYIEDHLGIAIFKDKDFRENLYIHMDKAISRVQSGMCITDPLLKEIKKEYSELFQVVRDAVNEVFPKNFFPDDEIVYIVMYFAVALDKTMKKVFRILVVCSGGMGSSKMLAHRIEQEIPEISVKKTVSLLGFARENLDEYDLILATIPLYIDKSQYLKVSPLLNKEELNQVREELKRHKYKTLRKITVKEKEKRQIEKGSDIENIITMKNMLDTALDMVEHFQIITKEKSETPIKDLEYILEAVEECEIKDEVNKVQDGKKYFQIPTTELVYFEMKHEVNTKPRIFVCHFEKPQYLEGEETYHDVIYVLYSSQLQEYEKSLLNHLVGAMVDDTDLQNAILSKNVEGVKQWLGYQIKQYMAELFNL
ncbi:MAG: transcription antiterminator [Anaerostipes sp.]|nr:transcription antiterminator [Anaerostipes sp.]